MDHMMLKLLYKLRFFCQRLIGIQSNCFVVRMLGLLARVTYWFVFCAVLCNIQYVVVAVDNIYETSHRSDTKSIWKRLDLFIYRLQTKHPTKQTSIYIWVIRFGAYHGKYIFASGFNVGSKLNLILITMPAECLPFESEQGWIVSWITDTARIQNSHHTKNLQRQRSKTIN